jgi:hypothetical protein
MARLTWRTAWRFWARNRPIAPSPVRSDRLCQRPFVEPLFPMVSKIRQDEDLSEPNCIVCVRVGAPHISEREFMRKNWHFPSAQRLLLLIFGAWFIYRLPWDGAGRWLCNEHVDLTGRLQIVALLLPKRERSRSLSSRLICRARGRSSFVYATGEVDRNA